MTQRIVFTHHKCLSTWLHATTRAIASLRGETLGDFWEDADRRGSFDWLIVHNSGPHCFDESLGDFRAIHIVRDPRDIVVSGYFSHRYSHETTGWPELQAHRAIIEQLGIGDGLLLEIEFLRPNFEELAAWDYRNPAVLEMRAEEAMADDGGLAFWRRALTWLGAELPDESLKPILQRFSFRSLAGRERGQEDRRHHYRKGVAGDWRNYFEPRHVKAMSEWSHLTRRLGDGPNRPRDGIPRRPGVDADRGS